MFKTKSEVNLARLWPGVQSSAKNRNPDAGMANCLRQVGVEEIFQLAFRQCANLSCRHFAVLKQQQSRDAANAVFRRSTRVLIDVQFSYGQFARTTLPRNRRGLARQP